MGRELQGKRVVLTGASSGIGNALARTLAAAGTKLVVAARSADKLGALEAELRAQGAEVMAVPCDVTRADDRELLVSAAVARWGGIDVLINNAGVAAWGHFQTS